jgi:hypothetical protein
MKGGLNKDFIVYTLRETERFWKDNNNNIVTVPPSLEIV